MCGLTPSQHQNRTTPARCGGFHRPVQHSRAMGTQSVTLLFNGTRIHTHTYHARTTHSYTYTFSTYRVMHAQQHTAHTCVYNTHIHAQHMHTHTTNIRKLDATQINISRTNISPIAQTLQNNPCGSLLRKVHTWHDHL